MSGIYRRVLNPVISAALVFLVLSTFGPVQSGVQHLGPVGIGTLAYAANEVPTFDQCANGSGAPQGLTCVAGWINGNLNQNNAFYSEDDVVPQRAVLHVTDLSVSTHTFSFSYDTRKGGRHSYDSLATWNQTIVNAKGCQELTVADFAGCGDGDLGNDTSATYPIPPDSQVVCDNSGLGSPTSGHQRAGVLTMYGGTVVRVDGATVTSGGGAAAAELLERLTCAPPAGAWPLSITIAPGCAPPVMTPGEIVSDFSDGGIKVNCAAAEPELRVAVSVTGVGVVTCPVCGN